MRCGPQHAGPSRSVLALARAMAVLFALAAAFGPAAALPAFEIPDHSNHAPASSASEPCCDECPDGGKGACEAPALCLVKCGKIPLRLADDGRLPTPIAASTLAPRRAERFRPNAPHPLRRPPRPA